ncbi:MAG TPA: hypothetical protein VGL49_03045 [Acidimicrobiales bacterium]|jgi:hypothetical protein
MGEGRGSSQPEMPPERDPAGATGFADYVLMAALQAPKAPESPAAARTIAGLIGLLAAEGSNDEVAAILAPVPGGAVTFDVVATHEGPAVAPDRGGRTASPAPPPPAPPPRPLTGLRVGSALREASELAQNRDDLIWVVAVGADGLRRRVLERREGGPFRYLFPREDLFEGDAAACADALSRWQRHVGAGATPHNPLALLTPILPLPAGSDNRPGPTELATSRPDLAPSDTAALVHGPPPEVLAQTVRDAMADVTVEVDMGAIELVVGEALRSAIAVFRASGTPAAGGETTDGLVTHAALMGAAEQLHILMEAFNDRVRSGSRSLESLADELSARERSAAAFTDALGKSVNASIDRMLRHIDDRLDQLTAAPSTPPPDRLRPKR